MNKKKLFAVLGLFLPLVGITSCNVNIEDSIEDSTSPILPSIPSQEPSYTLPSVSNDDCNHILSESYTYNKTSHYKSCKCGSVKHEEAHNFTNNVCVTCNMYLNEKVFDVFGDNTIIYTSNDNPYNIDILQYADNINAIFYDANIKDTKDIY